MQHYKGDIIIIIVMIGSPDLLAFTSDTEFLEQSTESSGLPSDLSVPLHSEDASPWWKPSGFVKDFVLVSEFSEQVGPQPLLTIPDKSKACGSFDLNHFSLRIMSVDYQTTSAGAAASGHPRLNFVEDAKVVLGDSGEGAYAYVHHLTLYDLEARGFVRPFCMAYVSSEQDKILNCFRQLSAEFSKASECLKTGNRKNFAKELEKKLCDLEYTRFVLLREMNQERLGELKAAERNGMDGKGEGSRPVETENANIATKEELKEKRRCNSPFMEVDRTLDVPRFGKKGSEARRDAPVTSNGGEKNKGGALEQPEATEEGQRASWRSVMWADKEDELAHVEKAVREHRSLLKQITSYPNRKLRDPEFFPYEPDDAFRSLEPDLDPDMPYSQSPAEERLLSHTPQLVSSGTCRQFDKRLKNLDELCDKYFLEQALDQLGSIERSFRGDNSHLLAQHRTQNLLRHLKSTNFLFENPDPEAGQLVSRPHPPSPKLRPVSPLHSQPVSLESYASCVEMVPIRLEMHRNADDSGPASPCDDSAPNFPTEGRCKSDDVPAPMKDSASSGESIEVLGTEKSIQRSHGPVFPGESLPPRPTAFPGLEPRRRKVVTRRENSEDSIEVLSTTDSIIPDDLRASYPSAICEETQECEGDEDGAPSAPVINVDTGAILDWGAVSPLSEPSSLQDKHFLFTPDDFSDCTSYRSVDSAGSLLSLRSYGEKRTPASRRKRGRTGRTALNFLRQFPFAVHAVSSLLSGRTLVVLGSEEKAVRGLVAALSVYTPHLGRSGGIIRPWTSSALHITDLLTWKLVGVNRSAFPSSPGVPRFLSRFGRYLSVLDVDQKTLRCPAYKGSLVCPLVDARSHGMRGATYFLYAQTLIARLVSKAFLHAFAPALRNPGMEFQAVRILGELHEDDLKILRYLSELVARHAAGNSPAVLRFSYTACTLFKT